MFSPATAAMLAAPRLCTPMMPTLSFSFGERLWAAAPGTDRRLVAAAQIPIPAKAEFRRNSRRFSCRFIVNSSVQFPGSCARNSKPRAKPPAAHGENQARPSHGPCQAAPREASRRSGAGPFSFVAGRSGVLFARPSPCRTRCAGRLQNVCPPDLGICARTLARSLTPSGSGAIRRTNAAREGKVAINPPSGGVWAWRGIVVA